MSINVPFAGVLNSKNKENKIGKERKNEKEINVDLENCSIM